MPFYSYQCTAHGEFTNFYKTFNEGEPWITAAHCQTCDKLCGRLVESPFPAMLFGNPAGYSKPSPSGRYSTKLINVKGN